MVMICNEAFLGDQAQIMETTSKMLGTNSSFKQVAAREHFIAFRLPHSFHLHLGTQ
jgi:hypothetical protein